MAQMRMFGQRDRRDSRNRLIVVDGDVVDPATGEVYDPVAEAARLRWTTALAGDGMPPHQYLVFSGQRAISDVAVDVLLTAIRYHPDAYNAYFRGYRSPMRYLELPDDHRYWRTVLGRTHMLNRCTLDSVEPPRRVDQGARPLPWDGPPWAPQGSPWPPGYSSDGRGRHRYDPALDWRKDYRCRACGKRFYPSPFDRPCPKCGLAAQAPSELKEGDL